MDLMLLRMFQRQIVLQCEFVLRAADEINVALKNQDAKGAFYSIQSLLNAAANIAKALWGRKNGKKIESARAPLRDSLGVKDESALRQLTMRHHYEHYDERLDEWWETSTRHNHFDLSVMPRNAIEGLDDVDAFRMLDPQTGDLTFWGENFNILKIVDEVMRLYPTASQEANKPHWEAKKAGPSV